MIINERDGITSTGPMTVGKFSNTQARAREVTGVMGGIQARAVIIVTGGV